jgi:hypothetical protein
MVRSSARRRGKDLCIVQLNAEILRGLKATQDDIP